MKQIILYITFFNIVFNVFGQINPIDSVLYSNGDLKAIKYEKMDRLSGYSLIRYFKKSLNELDKNIPLFDTIYNNNLLNNSDWTHYKGDTRVFFDKGSYVWIEKSTKNGNNNDSIFFNIRGGYSFLFKNFNNIEVSLAYNQDTSISSINISLIDTNKKGHSFKEHFYRTYYNSGIKFKVGEGLNVFKCGQYGTLELEFSFNNLLQKVYFYPTNTDKETIYYEFYDNYICKKTGYLKGRLPVGIWKEYHKNGNLKSVEYYEINNNNKLMKWKYFNNDGSIINEKW